MKKELRELLEGKNNAKEIVAWTVPNSFERPIRAIVKDGNGQFLSLEYSPHPRSYSKRCWHRLYPFVVEKENVEATMRQFAFAGYDNADSEIHWTKEGF